MITSTTREQTRSQYAASLLGALAVVALAPAITLANIGLLATASAIPGGEWDIEYYDHCIAAGFPVTQCCIESGGDWTGKYFGDPAGKCVAPGLLEGHPGQSATPPVFQNPPTHTGPQSAVTRGPNSGTLG